MTEHDASGLVEFATIWARLSRWQRFWLHFNMVLRHKWLHKIFWFLACSITLIMLAYGIEHSLMTLAFFILLHHCTM